MVYPEQNAACVCLKITSLEESFLTLFPTSPQRQKYANLQFILHFLIDALNVINGTQMPTFYLLYIIAIIITFIFHKYIINKNRPVFNELGLLNTKMVLTILTTLLTLYINRKYDVITVTK